MRSSDLIFRVAELGKLWALGRETVRQLVMYERMW
jgi:hypothetical protein